MKKLITILFSTLILAIFVFYSCKKSDSSSTSSAGTYAAPTLAKDTLINIPQNMITKSSSDYNLALGVEEIDIVNALSTGLSGAFYVDQSTMGGWQSSKNSDGSTSFIWKYLNEQIKLTYYNTSSESWWKYEIDSASYSFPYYYIDDKGTSGETDWYDKANFKSAQLTLYKDTWTKTGGTFNSTFNFYNNDGVTVSDQYVSVSNADKSGTLTVYGQINNTGSLVKQWYYTWTSSGTGSYIYYNSNGTIKYQGTF